MSDDVNVIYDHNRDIDLKPHKLGIITWPDDRLHTKCHDIVAFDDENDHFLEQLKIDMVHTMVENNGVGLAASQVGILANFIVLLVHDNPYTGIAMINPEIIRSSDELFEWEEGCISVPGYYEKRSRPENIIVKYYTLTGEEKEVELNGLIAFAAQHEIDHLRGKVFVDNAGFVKKAYIKKKIKNFFKKGKRF